MKPNGYSNAKVNLDEKSFQGTKSIFYIKHPSKRLRQDVG